MATYSVKQIRISASRPQEGEITIVEHPSWLARKLCGAKDQEFTFYKDSDGLWHDVSNGLFAPPIERVSAAKALFNHGVAFDGACEIVE